MSGKEKQNVPTTRVSFIWLPLYSIAGGLKQFIEIVKDVAPTHILDTRAWPKSNSATFGWTDIDTLQQVLNISGLPSVFNLPEIGMPQDMRPRRNETVDTGRYGDYLFSQSSAIHDYFNQLGEGEHRVLALTVDPVLERDQREGLQAVFTTLVGESIDLSFETVMGKFDRVPTARQTLQQFQTQVMKERRATLSLLRQLTVSEGFDTLPEEVRDRVTKSSAYMSTQLTA